MLCLSGFELYCRWVPLAICLCKKDSTKFKFDKNVTLLYHFLLFSVVVSTLLELKLVNVVYASSFMFMTTGLVI